MSSVVNFIKNVDAEREAAKKFDELLPTIGDTIVGEIKKRTPVDTGRLKQSFKFEKNGFMKGEVSTTVPYAIYVEIGTYKMPSHHMMERGVKAGKDMGLNFLKSKLSLT